jgi:hypothetical protein
MNPSSLPPLPPSPLPSISESSTENPSKTLTKSSIESQPLQQLAFVIGVYRTSPFKILEILPLVKRKNPYAHVKSKVKSY